MNIAAKTRRIATPAPAMPAMAPGERLMFVDTSVRASGGKLGREPSSFWGDVFELVFELVFEGEVVGSGVVVDEGMDCRVMVGVNGTGGGWDFTGAGSFPVSPNLSGMA